jgi:hypothetical protein
MEQMTPLDIERDRTIQDEAEGAVAGRGDDDDEEISSGNVSKAATVVRARDKSSELKNFKLSYASKVESLVATGHGWAVFG